MDRSGAPSPRFARSIAAALLVLTVSGNPVAAGRTVAPPAAPGPFVVRIARAGIAGDWQALSVAGELTVEVANEGDADAGVPFRVAVYGDENGDGLFDPDLDSL
mgnify:CR=1 FL=1